MSYFDIIFNLLLILGLPIFIYYFYFTMVSILGFRKYEEYPEAKKNNRIAAVIAARNEEKVIGYLIDSIKKSNYPNDLLDVWVIPNNCTDQTEQVAINHNALVYNPRIQVKSKGDALKDFFNFILKNNDIYDAFCVFDADNLVDKNFFLEMNKVIEDGYLVAQGYRESKNPRDSWISGSQSIFYWVQNRFLNGSRRAFHMSAILNGTGFMVTSKLLKEIGFNTFTMTEDIEFSTQCILRNHRIAFVAKSIVYDEHPVDFDVSWNQRKRWSTGIIQVLYNYSGEIFKKLIKTKQWIYFDLLVYLITPYVQVISFAYTIASILVYILISIGSGYIITPVTLAIWFNIISIITTFLSAFISVKVEHHKVKCCLTKTYFAFWWFITSWTFINIEVFFNPITNWEPIKHEKSVSLNDLELQKEY